LARRERRSQRRDAVRIGHVEHFGDDLEPGVG